MHETERARRTLTGGALVAVAGLLASLALVYTNAESVGAVADWAERQQRTEAALGAASAARNALGQALLLVGTAPDPSVSAAALSEAYSVLDRMEQQVVIVVAESDQSAALEAWLRAVLDTSRRALDTAAAGDLAAAAEIATGHAPAAYDGMVGELVLIRDELAGSIAAAAAESSRIATASRFMVAFLVPGMAVLVAVVVARRRRRREELARELRHERALNRSKDQLIANLSHELRTPLTGIYTSALTIEEIGFNEPGLAMELTDVIIDQSADLTRMVEDLLVSAQADVGRLHFDNKPVAIKDVAGGLAREFGRFAVDLAWRIEPATVIADPGRLRQLLRNLVSNAAKYGGGEVRILGAVRGGRYVIDVVDNGSGVPPEVEERMFQRFIHRGDTPLIVGSVGLGLAITKVLAEGMHGMVTYHRRNGETVFELMLTMPPPEPVDPSPAQPAVLMDDAETPIEAS